jgi:Ca2+-binding EF-hand superfamily protein
MKEIVQFAKTSKFNKLISSLLVGLRQDSEDILILKELFYKIDTNQDGSISREEFEKATEDLADEEFFQFNQNWD